MTYSLHPEASKDLAEVITFYRQSASPRVAARFLDEFERVARLLVANPGFGTPFLLPRRIYPLRTYPYSVVYRQVEGGVRVLAVRHQRRVPDFAKARS